MSATFSDQDGTVRLRGTLSDAAGFQVVTLTLTPAEILALNTTPAVLVPAPGAGSMIFPLYAAFLLTFATTPYATATQLDVQLGNPPASGQLMRTGANFLAAAADDLNLCDVVSVGPLGSDPIDPTTFLDLPLIVEAVSADPTAGDSPVTVCVTYFVAAL